MEEQYMNPDEERFADADDDVDGEERGIVIPPLHNVEDDINRFIPTATDADTLELDTSLDAGSSARSFNSIWSSKHSKEGVLANNNMTDAQPSLSVPGANHHQDRNDGVDGGGGSAFAAGDREHQSPHLIGDDDNDDDDISETWAANEYALDIEGGGGGMDPNDPSGDVPHCFHNNSHHDNDTLVDTLNTDGDTFHNLIKTGKVIHEMGTFEDGGTLDVTAMSDDDDEDADTLQNLARAEDDLDELTLTASTLDGSGDSPKGSGPQGRIREQTDPVEGDRGQRAKGGGATRHQIRENAGIPADTINIMVLSPSRSTTTGQRDPNGMTSPAHTNSTEESLEYSTSTSHRSSKQKSQKQNKNNKSYRSNNKSKRNYRSSKGDLARQRQEQQGVQDHHHRPNSNLPPGIPQSLSISSEPTSFSGDSSGAGANSNRGQNSSRRNYRQNDGRPTRPGCHSRDKAKDGPQRIDEEQGSSTKKKKSFFCCCCSCCSCLVKLLRELPLAVRLVVIVAILAMVGSLAFLGVAAYQKHVLAASPTGSSVNTTDAAGATAASSTPVVTIGNVDPLEGGSDVDHSNYRFPNGTPIKGGSNTTLSESGNGEGEHDIDISSEIGRGPIDEDLHQPSLFDSGLTIFGNAKKEHDKLGVDSQGRPILSDTTVGTTTPTDEEVETNNTESRNRQDQVLVAGAEEAFLAGGLGFDGKKPSESEEQLHFLNRPQVSSGLTVGAYYYPWYSATNNFHGDAYLRGKLIPPQRPSLQEYDSANATVIRQHLQWSQGSGINLWVMSWWGPNSTEDVCIKDNILPVMTSQQALIDAARKNNLRAEFDGTGDVAKGRTVSEGGEDGGGMKFAVHYETQGRLNMTTDDRGRVKTVTLEQVESDLEYLAKTYFGHKAYYRINGRPVIFVYLTRVLDRPTLRNLVEKMRAAVRSGMATTDGETEHEFFGEIYIVGDEAFGPLGNNLYAEYYDALDAMEVLDAVTNYDVYGSIRQDMAVMHGESGPSDLSGIVRESRSRAPVYSSKGGFTSSDIISETTEKPLPNDWHLQPKHHFAGREGVDAYHNEQGKWRSLAQSALCGYIPTVSPGFNDRGVRLQANHDALSRRLTPSEDFGSLFEYQLNRTLGQVDTDLASGLLMINSWNEWHEDTQIEPLGASAFRTTTRDVSGQEYTQALEYEAYGTLYLDLLKNAVTRDGAIPFA